ncbi:hypothetical protein BaRGS_00039747 [Batillaria attramentaria]|uniref:Uncharacterized protein n=1 Tax=Batillaria attramentaria TaxID=370345 RepID=A0ABD0J2V5_9CAEN
MATSSTPTRVRPLQASSPGRVYPRVGASAPPPEDEELDCCVICQEPRRYLKTIPCGHAFCECCLQRTVNEHNDQQFPCPMCRAYTPVPKGGASGFPINVTKGSRKVIDPDIAAAAALTASDDDKDLCDACGVDLSRYSCIECQQAVCEWCQTNHEGDQHTLVVIRKMRDLDSAAVALSKENCQKHGGREFRSFCRTCREPICELCEKLTHSRHTFEDLTAASARAKEKLVPIQRNVEQARRCVEAVLEDTERCRQMTRNEKQKSEQEIRAKADQLRAVVQQHENAALAELEHMGAKFERSYAADISNAQDKLAGLQVIERHLNKVLSGESHPDMVRLEEHATHSVGQKGYLHKFTSGLPTNIFHIHTKQDDHAWLTDPLRKVVGTLREKQDRRVVPVVKVVSELTCHDNRVTRVLHVCPAGDEKLWVAYKPDLHSHSITLALFNGKTGNAMKQERVDGLGGLVNIDQRQCFAWLRSSGRLLKVDANNSPVVLRNAPQNLIFSKGKLRAYMQCKTSQYDITPVTSLEQLVRLDKQREFHISCSDIPLTMDCSSNGETYAVVDRSLRVHLYRRGAANPYSTYPSGNKPTSQKIADACFYHISGREFLLVADETYDDVLVFDVQRGCRLVRDLTERSGRLANPTALNVDPDTGKLLVGCVGGRMVVCGDTGLKAEKKWRQTLAALEIVH